jgi:aspartyl-tRNA(Asn)/glutamyl-tRNA(Gln) amidotransferase subunit A
MALSWTMDKLGPMAHTAEDCGAVLAAIAGADRDDPSAVDRPFAWPAEGPAGLKKIRLATLRGACDRVQPEVRANFERSLADLAPFAEFQEVELPDFPYGLAAGTIIDCEAAAAFEGLVTGGEIARMAAPEDRIGLQARLLIPAKDYINALRLRRLAQRKLDAWLSPFDAVVAPALAAVASPLGVDFNTYAKAWRDTDLSGGENLAGLPGICLPNGMGERGLPTSLLFVSRAFDEVKLLAIAARYQRATAWHKSHPTIDGDVAN